MKEDVCNAVERLIYEKGLHGVDVEGLRRFLDDPVVLVEVRERLRERRPENPYEMLENLRRVVDDRPFGYGILAKSSLFGNAVFVQGYVCTYWGLIEFFMRVSGNVEIRLSALDVYNITYNKSYDCEFALIEHTVTWDKEYLFDVVDGRYLLHDYLIPLYFGLYVDIGLSVPELSAPVLSVTIIALAKSRRS